MLMLYSFNFCHVISLGCIWSISEDGDEYSFCMKRKIDLLRKSRAKTRYSMTFARRLVSPSHAYLDIVNNKYLCSE